MDYLEINELYHHQIKGAKWGIRRYQNYDGTLTEEGRLRYNPNYKKNKADGSVPTKDKEDGNYYYKNKDGDKVLYKTRTDQLSNEELSDLSKRVNLEKSIDKENESVEYPKPPERPNTSQAFRDASKLTKDISESLPKGNGRVVKKNYSNLSDQELKDRINRLQLEDNYGRLSGDTKYIKSGSEKAREFLQTAGALLAITGSAVALANTIADMQDKKRLRMQQSMRQSDILDEDENSLEHHGILGMKWGIRRYQNEDGTLTAEGQARYGGKTHVDELTDEEKADLQEAGRKDRNKKIAIGVGVAAAAAAVTVGAVWLAKRKSAANMMQKPIDNLPDNDDDVQDILGRKFSNSRDTINAEVVDDGFKSTFGKKSAAPKDTVIDATYDEVKSNPNANKKSPFGKKSSNNARDTINAEVVDDGIKDKFGKKSSNQKDTIIDSTFEEVKNNFGSASRPNATKGEKWGTRPSQEAEHPHATKGEKWGVRPHNVRDTINAEVVDDGVKSMFGQKAINTKGTIIDATINDVTNNYKQTGQNNLGSRTAGLLSSKSDQSSGMLALPSPDPKVKAVMDKVSTKSVDSIKSTSSVSDKDISSLIAKIDGPSSSLFNTKTYQSTPTVSSGTQKIGDKSLTRTVTANFTSDDVSDSKERSFLNRFYMPKERFDSNNEAEFTKKFIDTFGEAEYKKTLDRRNPFEARGYSTSISRDSSTVRPRGVSAKSSAPQSVKDKISAYKESHKVSNSSVYVKNGALYKYHNGKEVLVNGGADSRYTYVTNSSGQILRKLKEKFTPKGFRHADSSDYLIFREMYFSSFDTLAHHGIKGQKWGVRRFQDQNGTLTPEGRKRYRSDQGTREILENTSSYNDLSKANRREYANYGRTSGGKKGFILGMGAGALVGAGKAVFDTVLNKDRVGKSFGYSSGAIVNRFVRNTMLGALGGSVVGTLIGSSVGKRSAQAELADKGHEYTSALMNVPIRRLLRSV